MLFSNNGNYQNLTDKELVARYQDSGDVGCVVELFRRYQTQVFGVCLDYLKNVEDGKDAVMEIFIKVCASLLNEQVTNFKSWLFRVTVNYCIDKLREKKRRAVVKIDDNKIDELLWKTGNYVRPQDDLPEDNLEDKLIQKLLAAIPQLREEQRVCIELHYWEKKSYKEIAEITSFTWNEVKSHIQNGKRNLYNMLNHQRD